MTEKRSVKKKVVIDYVHLDDGSDIEFFDVPKKTKKCSDVNYELSNENKKLNKVSKTTGEKNKEKKSKKKKEIITDLKETENVSYNISSKLEKKLNSFSKCSQSPSSKSDVVKASPHTPSLIASCPTTFVVTPTSGLRIGLSRNRKFKSLHSNIRYA